MNKETIVEDILKAIITNDVKQFRGRLFELSNIEIASLRLMEEELNVLQTICFYNAESMIEVIRERFKDDEGCSFQLGDYGEPYQGNKALHFAVLSGNMHIIDFILNELKADPKQVTKTGLNALHCAA